MGICLSDSQQATWNWYELDYKLTHTSKSTTMKRRKRSDRLGVMMEESKTSVLSDLKRGWTVSFGLLGEIYKLISMLAVDQALRLLESLMTSGEKLHEKLSDKLNLSVEDVIADVMSRGSGYSVPGVEEE